MNPSVNPSGAAARSDAAPTHPAVRPELAQASPLAALNAHIEQAAQAASDKLSIRPVAVFSSVGVQPFDKLRAGAPQALQQASGEPPTYNWPELRSAQRFRETWERLGAEQQVQQAQASAPQNAGPLNPQRLVVDTLAFMGERSPHYLRRFLAQTEALMWLEQAQGQIKTAQSAVNPARQKPAPRTPKKR